MIKDAVIAVLNFNRTPTDDRDHKSQYTAVSCISNLF